MMSIEQSVTTDTKRSVVNAHILLSTAQAHGIAPATVLAGCALDEQELRSPTGLISARDELQMIRNVLARKPLETGIGLATGSRYHLAAFGIWGFALANSATVGEAARLSIAHSAMTFAFCQLSIEEAGDCIHWYFDDAGMPPDLKCFIIEREMAALGTVSHDLLGADFEALQISFNYPEPNHSALYGKYFNGPLQFDADRSGFTLPRALLARPLQVPDEVLKHAGASELRRQPPKLGDRVRNAVSKHLASMPTMDAIANELGMTARTLRRKLEKEGTTYRQLVDDVRCERAKELLEHTTLSVGDIAEHLTYADASSFSQAFRRLAGVSPAAYRQSKRQPVD